MTTICLIFGHFGPFLLFFALFFSPTQNFLILRTLPLITIKVLWLGLSVNVRQIHKLKKYPKIAQVLSLKVRFLTSERYGSPVPHIYEFHKFYYFWLKIYFFYLVRRMILYHLLLCIYFGENLSGLTGIDNKNFNFQGYFSEKKFKKRKK